jgi:hypothetical protein
MSGDTTSLQATMLPRTAPFEGTQEPQVKQAEDDSNRPRDQKTWDTGVGVNGRAV